MRFSTCRMSISVSSCDSRCSRRCLDVEHLQHLLLLLELERQVRGDGVGQAPGLVDAGRARSGSRAGSSCSASRTGRTARAARGASPRPRWRRAPRPGSALASATQCVRRSVDLARCARALPPSTSTFTVPSGSLSICRMLDDAADLVQVLGPGLVLGGGLLRHQQDALARLHRGFQRLDRLRAPDEQRDHHVREHHHVAQRQQRELDAVGCGQRSDM